MILDRLCPVCGGAGERECLCEGRGLVASSEDALWAEHGVVLSVVPPPPAVMARPCADCAFRADSPERDDGSIRRIRASDAPFYCHQGMHCTADGRYIPRERDATGAPIGHPLCAGWTRFRAAAGASP